ncbi:MAG: choice-of-anchor J domain-containing protein [Bacteroidales bacterium]|jgi:PKD repeat protein|nr:choice-of-anchor J domain-containing protein [Bacteroidales bacterium]
MKTRVSLFSAITFLILQSIIPDKCIPANFYGIQSYTSDTTYTMDFESIADFSLTFGDWTVNDVDHNPTYGIINHTFPHQMEPMAFICFTPAQVAPSMAADPNIQPHSGQRFGACFSSDPPSNNDWFISPQIQLGTNGVFSFWVKSYSDLYGLDKYQVLVSVSDNNPSSFSSISGPDSLQTTLNWIRKNFSLSKFDNQKVYVAIRCVSKDNYLMMIDDLEVRTSTSNNLVADFIADKTMVRVGENVNFTDQSTGSPTTWNWKFPGGTPATSNLQNPVNIMYSYSGSYPVTLVVSNGTSHDSLTKNAYITVTTYPSNVSLDFESLENFSLVFDPWTTIDVGGGNTWGINGISFLHQFEPMAYICFVPSRTLPPLTNMVPHSGEKMGCSFSSENPQNPNNKWLISPKMSLGNSPQIELWVQTYNPNYGDEQYNIAVSTTDLNPSSFVPITSTPEAAPGVWTKKTYSLPDYANQTVYVGIQCVTVNGFIFMIDDISITSAVGIDEPSTRKKVTIYPNPASEKMTLSLGPNGTGPFSVDLINSLGETIRSWNETGDQASVTYNIRGIPSGIYIVRLQEVSGAKYGKITILN